MGSCHKSWQIKVLSVLEYENMWCTDTCAWYDLAVMLKCAIMVMYDNETLGSCCEKHPTHLTNGLDILCSFPHLTPSKCASDSGSGGKSPRPRCHCLYTNARAYFYYFSQNKRHKCPKHYDAMQRDIITIPLWFYSGTIKKTQQICPLLTSVPLFIVGFKSILTCVHLAS